MLFLLATFPHILYFFVWRFTKQFNALIGNRDPIRVVANIGITSKIMLIAYIFVAGLINENIYDYVKDIRWWNICFIGCGQLLNGMVFYRLGNNGVFYGNKFGFNIPWVTGFPFNVFPHPQYLGAVLSLIGLYPLVSCNFIMYSSLLYAITAFIETHL